MSQQGYSLDLLDGGKVIQSPDIIWNAVCSVTNQLLQPPVKAHDVAAVSISAQRCTFLGVNQHYEPLIPFISWMDSRGLSQTEKISQIMGSRYSEISGLLPVPQPSVNKIMWLREKEPRLYESIFHFTSLESYLLAKLGVDHPPVSHSLGSYMGLLNNQTLRWSTEILDQLSLDCDKLPALSAAGVVTGTVSSAAASASGFAKETLLVTGGGDLQCSGLGAGVINNNRAVLNVGTAAGLLFHLPHPVHAYKQGLVCPAYSVPNTWEMEGHAQASATVLEWFNNQFGAKDDVGTAKTDTSPFQKLSGEAEKASAGSQGLIFVPTFNGVGAPFWHPQMRGFIYGLTLRHRRRDIVRALMEGISYEMSFIKDVMPLATGIPIKEIGVTGGGANSDIWNQIHADVFDLPVVRPRIKEASAVGACVCAGVGAGVFSSFEDGVACLVVMDKVYKPNSHNKAIYQEARVLYKGLISQFGGSQLDTDFKIFREKLENHNLN